MLVRKGTVQEQIGVFLSCYFQIRVRPRQMLQRLVHSGPHSAGVQVPSEIVGQR